MGDLRQYRLLPVPMHLDDPHWRASWRRKPCLVYHVSEGQARGAAARFFARAQPPAGGLAGLPWDDPYLVVCEVREVPDGLMSDNLFGAVRDLGGDPITKDDQPSDALQTS